MEKIAHASMDQLTVPVVDWELCVQKAQERLRDIITAANKADPYEMQALVMSSIFGDVSEFMQQNKDNEVTLIGDQEKELWFKYRGHKFHVTFDREADTRYLSDRYFIWCEAKSFNGENTFCNEVFIDWVCGAGFMEEKWLAYKTHDISSEELEDYIKNDAADMIDVWLVKNEDMIDD